MMKIIDDMSVIKPRGETDITRIPVWLREALELDQSKQVGLAKELKVLGSPRYRVHHLGGDVWAWEREGEPTMLSDGVDWDEVHNCEAPVRWISLSDLLQPYHDFHRHLTDRWTELEIIALRALANRIKSKEYLRFLEGVAENQTDLMWDYAQNDEERLQWAENIDHMRAELAIPKMGNADDGKEIPLPLRDDVIYYHNWRDTIGSN